MNQFCFVGICAGLAMLMLMIMPSSIADDELEINVEGDKNAIVYVNETDTVSTVKEKIVEQLTKNINEEIDIIKEKLIGNKNKTHKLMETLKVNVNENIKILEAKLEEKNYENNEILPARITLRLNENGSPLEDGKTMKECGIVKDTVPKTIYLTWDELEIKVKGDKNVKNVIVYVKDTDKVSELKLKIIEKLKVNVNENIKILEAKLEEKKKEKNKILTARKTLRQDKYGSPLEDDEIVNECGIKTDKYGNYAYVYLTLGELEIKVEGDKNITVYAKETDKVSKLKQTIVEKLRKNINEEHDIIEDKLSEANAKETEFITFIKEKLFGKNKRIGELKVEFEEKKKKEKNKILTARKTLRLDKNGSPPFEDEKTISEYVKKDATVFLELEGYEILVDYKGKTYTIWVNKEDTVYELKEKIQKVIQIRHSEQKLPFPAHEDVPDDSKTMQFYNIGKGNLLSLKREFKIDYQYNKKDYFQIVENTDKVSSVKDMVKEMIQEKSGIQLNNIKLLCYGEELKDDKEIGSYYGIDSTMVYVYQS